jgi:hypothetical protein
MSFVMSHPFESVRFGKGLHFRVEDGVLSCAVKNRQVGIVNDAHPCATAPEPERFVEKTFHPEPVEIWVELDISHLAPAQIEPAQDDCPYIAGYVQSERGGIVLHLLAGDIIHLVAAGVCLLADTELAEHTGQGGIADLYFLFFRQDLMNALHVSITASIQPAEHFRIYLFLVTSGLCRTIRIVSQYFSHCLGREIEKPGDLFLLFPFPMENLDRFSFLLVDHETTLMYL